MKGSGYVARTGEIKNAYKILVVNPERKKSFGRHKCRWEGTLHNGP